VGIVSLIFYVKKKKFGMLVIAIAFFLNAVGMHILLGSTMFEYLHNSGWEAYRYALYSGIVGFGFLIVFTILIVIGLFMLYKEMKQQLP
jgi:hypothetical protein